MSTPSGPLAGVAITTGLLLAFAAGGCTAYKVNRAALVPHAQPTLRSGQPAVGWADLAAGAGAIADIGRPEQGDSTSALEVPALQLAGAVRLHLTPNFDMGLIYEHGFDAGAHKLKDRQLDVDAGDTSGIGMSYYYSIRMPDPRWRVGVALDVLAYSVPYVEYGVCVEYCEGVDFTYQKEGRSSVTVGSLGVVPSFRSGKATWFGSVTLRNHPTIEQRGRELDYDGGDGDVVDGPNNYLFAAGVEYDLWQGVRGSVILYQDASQNPVSYVPSLAAMLTVPLVPMPDGSSSSPLSVTAPTSTPY